MFPSSQSHSAASGLPAVYIFIFSKKIGGAEKRFLGLWEHLCIAHPERLFYLIVTPEFYQTVVSREFDAGFLQTHGDKIRQRTFSSGFWAIRRAVQDFVRTEAQRGSIFHFIGDHPLTHWRGIQQLFSITQSSLKNLNVRGQVGQWLGGIRSQIVDILDPGIFRQFGRRLFYKRNRLHQTTSSYCDTEKFLPVPFPEKKDWLVFLGRFEEMKQVHAFVDAIPALWTALKERAGTDDLRFFVLGHGTQEESLRTVLREERFRDIPVEFGFNPDPAEILNKSKLFFSLQRHNNYPSRSLIEAFAAGNAAVVTDIGQTRWLARPEFSFYVPESFTGNNLVDAVLRYYTQTSIEQEQQARKAREFVMKEHTIERMTAYYLNLYNQLSTRNGFK